MVDNSDDLDKQYENRRFMKKSLYRFSPRFFFYLFWFLVIGLLIWAEIDYGFLGALWKTITRVW